MRVIGLDVHRSFAVVALLEGGEVRSGGRVDLTRDAVIAFGRQLRADDEVVLEATCLSHPAHSSFAGGIPRASGADEPACRLGSRPRRRSSA